MKKRILPALLALCMVLSLLPVSVFAETTGACGCDTDTCTTCSSSCECKAAVKNADGSITDGQKCDSANCKYAVDTHTEEECIYSGKIVDKTTHTQAVAPEVDDDDEEEVPEANMGKCTDPNCSAYNTVVDLDTHVHDDVTAGNCADGDANNSKKVNCAGTTHYAGCPKICGVGGCTKTANHTGENHNAAVCTNDDQCNIGTTASDLANHKATCPKVASIDVGAGKTRAVYTGTFTFTVDCTCDDFKHDADNNHVGTTDTTTCTHSDEITVDVSVAFEYESTLVKADYDTNAEYNAALEAEKEEQIKAFDHSTADAAAQSEWEDANDADHYICSICAAQISAEAKSECTMAFDCSATEHNKNCLSLCTHDANCPNEQGNSAAHTVWYVVYKGTSASMEAQGTRTTRTSAEELYKTVKAANDAAVASAKRAYDDAVAALERNTDEAQTETLTQAVATAKTAYDNAAKVVVTLIAEHCPVAGIADSTVIAADGTQIDDTTTPDDSTDDEVKAPEKAEDFADLEGTEWYAEELTALIEKGVFKGSIDGGVYSFKATDPMNTSTLVVLISRVLDLGHNTEGTNWDVEATKWATDEGLLEGIEAGEVARKDVILVLWRAAGSPESEQDLSDFEDAADLDGDHLAAMKWAVENGIIKGDGDTGTLKTDDVITRAEMVAVIARFDGVVNK